MGDKADSGGTIKRKTANAIKNPIIFDNVNLKKYLVDFENELASPCPIRDIINYEDSDEYDSELNKIIITGTALNESFATLTIYDTQAKTFMKNLKFKSAFKPITENSNELDLKYEENNLPSYEKLLLFYPLDKSPFEPLFGETFQNYLNENNNNALILDAKDKNDNIQLSAEYLSTVIFDSVVSSIQNTLDTYEEFKDKEILSIDDLVILKRQFSSLSTQFYELNAATIEENISAYTENDRFSSIELASTISNSITCASSLLDDISKTYEQSNFKVYLREHGDLYSSTDIDETIDGVELSAYVEKYLTPSFNSIKNDIKSLSELLVDVKDYTGLSDEDLRESLNFRYTGNKISYVNDDGIQAVSLGYDSTISAYFDLSGKKTLAKEILDLIFKSNRGWTNELKERYPISGSITSGAFMSSVRGATLTFWSKIYSDANYSDALESIRFKLNEDKWFALRFGGLDNNLESQSDNMRVANLPSSYYDNNEYAMIEMKFDNLSEDEINIQVNAYYLDEDDEIQKTSLFGDSIIKYNLSGINITDDSGIYLGYPANENPFKGCFRNLTLFAGCLSENETKDYFKAGIAEKYEFLEEFKEYKLKDLIDSDSFYLGLVGIYDVENINIINCVMKYDGNTYVHHKETEE